MQSSLTVCRSQTLPVYAPQALARKLWAQFRPHNQTVVGLQCCLDLDNKDRGLAAVACFFAVNPKS